MKIVLCPRSCRRTRHFSEDGREVDDDSQGRFMEVRLFDQWPDAQGHFGPYGGKFAPETLMHPLEELERAYLEVKHDVAFQAELNRLFQEYSGRPTPLFCAERLTQKLGGARIYLKREDLNHTGAHKINNCLGQALLARRMGKRRIIAETGAGQHGVATATACLLDLDCEVYMKKTCAPGTECVPHAFAGRKGAWRGQRQQNPEGRHQRGHPGLGD
jgi:hypothetical protein